MVSGPSRSPHQLCMLATRDVGVLVHMRQWQQGRAYRMLPAGEGSSLEQGRMEAGRMGTVAAHKRPAVAGIHSRHTEAAPATMTRHQLTGHIARTADSFLAVTLLGDSRTSAVNLSGQLVMAARVGCPQCHPKPNPPAGCLNEQQARLLCNQVYARG